MYGPAEEKLRKWRGLRSDHVVYGIDGIKTYYSVLYVQGSNVKDKFDCKNIVVDKFVLKQELPNGDIIHF